MRRPIGLEHLTLLGEPVPVFVAAAAAGGADSVCLSVNHAGTTDRKILRGVLAQIADLGMTVSMGDGFLFAPGGGLDEQKRRLELVVDMGAPYANVCALALDAGAPRDSGLIEDDLGEFCQLARAAGVSVLIEFTPLSHVPSVAVAADLLARLDQPNLQIMLDTLHLARAGEGPQDVARLDPSLFGYCQLSDGLLVWEGFDTYRDEAMYERRIAGEGEFPLELVLALLPSDITVSAEVPLRSMGEAGVSPHERARLVLEGARRLVDRVTLAAGSTDLAS